MLMFFQSTSKGISYYFYRDYYNLDKIINLIGVLKKQRVKEKVHNKSFHKSSN